MGAGNSDSDFPVCTASALPTEPSPRHANFCEIFSFSPPSSPFPLSLSHEVQTQIFMSLRLSLSPLPPYLHLLSAGIIFVPHHNPLSNIFNLCLSESMGAESSGTLCCLYSVPVLKLHEGLVPPCSSTPSPFNRIYNNYNGASIEDEG